MRLVGKETYERVYIEKGVDSDKCPVFLLKRISLGEKMAIDDASFYSTDTGIVFKAGAMNKLKIKYGLADWKNIFNEKDEPIPCNDENKEKLPMEVSAWLLAEIDKLNGIGQVIVEQERKNS